MCALSPWNNFPHMEHVIFCGGRGDLDGVAFCSPSLLGPLRSVPSPEAVSVSSCGAGCLLDWLRCMDPLWGNSSEVVLSSARSILWTLLWLLGCFPSVVYSLILVIDDGFLVGEPRAFCLGTFRIRHPVSLTKGAFILSSFFRLGVLPCPGLYLPSGASSLAALL